MPTEEQKNKAISVCQSLSTFLQPIWLFRYDPLYKYIFIVAGKEEGIEIIIYEDGTVEFNQNDET